MKNLTNLFILIFMIVIMTGCQSPSTEDGGVSAEPVEYSPNAAADIATVQQLFDAMLAGDSAAMTNLTTDNFVSIYVTNPLDTVSREDFIKEWISLQTTRTDQNNDLIIATSMRVNVGEYIGDWVQYWGNYSAGMVSADTTVLIPYFTNLKMKDGKVDIFFSYYDRVPIWQAVGYQITPPGE